jgi:hypothetical protein
MKHLLFNIIVAGCALFLCACQHSDKTDKTETAFFHNFNLNATVEQMNVPQLQPHIGGGGFVASIGKTAERRRNIYFEYLLDEQTGGQFDESIFLNELNVKVAEQISNANVKAGGTGTINDGFYIDYSTDETKGSVDCIGAKVEKNRYKLWCTVLEIAGIEGDK